MAMSPDPYGGQYGQYGSYGQSGLSAYRQPDSKPLLHYEVPYPERLSRLLIFVKWLLIIPHLFVLFILGIAFYVTTGIAWFAILLLGRYPRPLWEFAYLVLRWTANVTAYLYLQRDEYPPFGEADYPVLFELAYPERQSRLLIFVKWLLIIPHLFVLYFLGILANICLFLAWWAILFTGRHPRGLFDILSGYCRWNYRVLAYTLLMTDRYPPFSMSQSEWPTTQPPVTPTQPGYPANPPATRWQ